MAKVNIEYTEQELKELIINDLANKMPYSEFKISDIKIEVKSKQNYKSEWETAAFRGVVGKHNV